METLIEKTQLNAFDVSIRTGIEQIVDGLRQILGAKLVAYIAGVSETRAVREWAEGERTPSPTAEQHLRVVFRIVRLIEQGEGSGVAATWFQGMNPLLGDKSPARVLREDRTEEARAAVVSAANAVVGA